MSAQPKLTEQQIDILNDMLKHKPIVLEPGTNESDLCSRVYTSSIYYGDSRYHIIDDGYDSVDILQVMAGEKYNARISFSKEEMTAFLAAIVPWYLRDELKQREEVKKEAERLAKQNEALDDLDDHPF